MENTEALYAQSYTEVVTILNSLPKRDFARIPKEKLEFYNAKMDRNYEYKLDSKKSFAEQKMLPITEAILAILYRDYLANEEEKQEIIKQDKIDWNILEDKKREKYNPDNLFKKKNTSNEETFAATEETGMTVVQEQKWYQKIFNIIKSIFHRN